MGRSIERRREEREYIRRRKAKAVGERSRVGMKLPS